MNKIKKGKISLTISIGLTAFILIFVMVTQFKTVEETDITGIEVMREAELRSELASWKSKYEDAVTKTQETENKIKEYTEQIDSNHNILELLEREIEEAEKYAGFKDLSGEGIEIVLEDNEKIQITDLDLMQLINELKIAGAEAISINEERIIDTTDISNIDYIFFYVNTGRKDKLNRISSPYTVKAIGNKKHIESAINIKYGFLDSMKAAEKTVSYKVSDYITIPKYNGSLDYKHATIVEEKN